MTTSGPDLFSALPESQGPLGTKPNNVRPVTSLQEDELAALATYAESCGISRSEAIRRGVLFVVRSREHILMQSRVLVETLSDVLDYDPHRNHNRLRPELYMSDERYLTHLKNLVTELKRLNDLLDKDHGRATSASASVLKLRIHVDEFLRSYAKDLGSGAAKLTLAAFANLMLHAGVDHSLLMATLAMPHATRGVHSLRHRN